MADILIRGMEMPKDTTKAEFGIDADGNPVCMVYHEDGNEPDIYDEDCCDCPLQSVCNRCFIGIPDEWPDPEGGGEDG